MSVTIDRASRHLFYAPLNKLNLSFIINAFLFLNPKKQAGTVYAYSYTQPENSCCHSIRGTRSVAMVGCMTFLLIKELGEGLFLLLPLPDLF